jgi:hypothetical protein
VGGRDHRHGRGGHALRVPRPRRPHRRRPQREPADPVASRFEKIQRENTELRRARRELAEHLELAIANIQRLTLDNHHLRQQLHAATKITHINARSLG